MAFPILWPDDLAQAGFVYGWRTPLVCVAGALPVQTLEEAETLLQRQHGLHDWSSFVALCGSVPTIIGRVHFDVVGHAIPTVEIFGIATTKFHLVHYVKPKLRHLQMYALDAVVSSKLRSSGDTLQPPIKPSNADPFMFDFTHPCSRQPATLNQTVVHQINFGQVMSEALARDEEHFKASGRPAQDSALMWPLVSATQARLWTKTSTFSTQVITRVSQLRELYQHFPPPSNSSNSVSPEAISSYVGFYNCLWLILNDIIIGLAVGTFICDNSMYISLMLKHCIERYLVADIQGTLLWLNNWPAGLKLNTELSSLYCHSLLMVMTGWNRLLTLLVLPHIYRGVYISGALGCCGMTMTVAVVSDILMLLTAHVYLCYLLSLAIFRQQLNAARSLWKLFRGKRENVLRHRTDSWVFDVDQLLFGTILFTLVAFIFPTTTAYYALFATMRLLCTVVYGILDIILNLVNQFPLFAMMLRLKDPSRLPDGLFFVMETSAHKNSIRNKPSELSSIFGHYSAYLSLLQARYHPLRLLKCMIAAQILES